MLKKLSGRFRTLLLLGLFLCLTVSWFVATSEPVWNWVGYPTTQQIAEMYELATELGYQPENELAFNKRICGGITITCRTKIAFASLTPLEPALINVQTSSSGKVTGPNVIDELRHVGARLVLDGKGYLDRPAPPPYPHITYRVLFNEREWVVTEYLTDEYPAVVEVNGARLNSRFIIISLQTK